MEGRALRRCREESEAEAEAERAPLSWRERQLADCLRGNGVPCAASRQVPPPPAVPPLSMAGCGPAPPAKIERERRRVSVGKTASQGPNWRRNWACVEPQRSSKRPRDPRRSGRPARNHFERECSRDRVNLRT